MDKTKAKTPVAELDGDEMTRVAWGAIEDRPILPRPGVERYGVGGKCATITAAGAWVEEFGLERMWRSPDGTIRNILDGTIFREPTIRSNAPPLLPGRTQPMVIGRHIYADIHRAAEARISGPGEVTLSYVPADGGEPIELDVHDFRHDFRGPGVTLGRHSTLQSIKGFARASFNYGLLRKCPVYLSTKNTILDARDEVFKDGFQDVFNREFRAEFDKLGLTYEHRLVDDMAAALTLSDGCVWACENRGDDVKPDRKWLNMQRSLENLSVGPQVSVQKVAA